MNCPFAWIALFFGAGIILQDLFNFQVELLLAALLFAVTCSLLCRRKRIFNPVIFSTVLTLGAFAAYNGCNLPCDHIVNFMFHPAPDKYIVEGVIASDIQRKDISNSFILHAQGLSLNNSMRLCRGKIMVYAPSKEKFEYGDRVLLSGKIIDKSGYKHFKMFKPYLVMRIGNESNIQMLTPARFSPLKLIFRIKERLRKIIISAHADFSSGIISAMVLGEKNRIKPHIYDAMIRCGTVHILVVSGFNVGVIAFVSMLSLKVVHLAPKARILATILITIGYCVITGLSTPVMRATIMATVFLLARVLRREPEIYNSLGIAALAILIIEPRQIFDIGFQLSFASVAGIVFFSGLIKSRLRPELIKPRIVRWLAEGAIVSFSAWMGSLGFIAFHFRTISPITVPANMIIVPLATLITLGGLSVILTADILPGFSRYLAMTGDSLVAILIFLISFLAKIPFSCINF
jgi:competence protein ComEC